MPLALLAALAVLLLAAAPEPQPSTSALPKPLPDVTAPPGRTMFTADMVEIGMPIQLLIPHVAAAAKENGIPLHMIAMADVVVRGRTIVSKGNMAMLVPVSGGVVLAGGGFSCEPVVGVVANTQYRIMMGSPVLPGLVMANQHQLLPISFANPRVPGSQNLFLVPMGRGCDATEIPVTVYVTGPPIMPESLTPLK